MTTYIFPGQGSQYKGMGGELFSQFPELTKKADDVLGYSIQLLCLEDPLKQLNQTQYTQPALYVVNALSYYKKRDEKHKPPAYMMGHSLGEYNALLAGGAFDFETGLQLVKKRAELMSQASGGAMAAIVGLKAEEVQNILDKNQHLDVTIANYNTSTQIVISGLQKDVLQASQLCEQVGTVLVIPLNVSGAFHSPHMRFAQEHFELFLRTFQITAPVIPVIANYSASPYTLENITQTLVRQITHPVRWMQSIFFLLEQGKTDFEEIGPGSVLTGLVQRIKNGK